MAIGPGRGSAAVAIALSPPPARAGRAGGAPALLAVAHANGSVVVHSLTDEYTARPSSKSRDEARNEWRSKLLELESYVT
jgi:hypothetical protein